MSAVITRQPKLCDFRPTPPPSLRGTKMLSIPPVRKPKPTVATLACNVELKPKQAALAFEDDIYAPAYQRSASQRFWNSVAAGTSFAGARPR